jgi:hypothetical protein
MRKLVMVALATLLLTGYCNEAMATGSIRDLWRDMYNAGTGGVCEKLSQASLDCTLCHTSGGSSSDLNPYAADVQFIKADQGLILWSAAFEAAEPEDSDGDGLTNIEEINGCALPGDPDDSTPGDETTWGEIKALYR